MSSKFNQMEKKSAVSFDKKIVNIASPNYVSIRKHKIRNN